MIEIVKIRKDNLMLQHIFQAEKDARDAIRARESAAVKNMLIHISEVSAIPLNLSVVDRTLESLRK